MPDWAPPSGSCEGWTGFSPVKIETALMKRPSSSTKIMNYIRLNGDSIHFACMVNEAFIEFKQILMSKYFNYFQCTVHIYDFLPIE